MQKSTNVLEKEQEILKSKIRRGDFVLLGQMLDVPKDTAKMRFYRCKEDAVSAMKKIMDNREALIKNHQPENQS